MDKYTVDIDKVLDAFEESEALQASQSIKTPTSAEQNRFLNFYNLGEKSEQSCFDEPFSNHNVNISSVGSVHQLLPANSDLSERCENTVKKCNMYQADFLPTVKTPDKQPFQNSQSWNYEIYYKSFQPFSKPSDEVNLPNSDFDFKSALSTSTGDKDTAKTSEKNDLLNFENRYNPEEEVLCISVERTDLIVDESVGKSFLKPASAQCESTPADAKINSDSLNPEQFVNHSVQSRTSETSVSCELKQSFHGQKVGSQLDVLVDSENCVDSSFQTLSDEKKSLSVEKKSLSVEKKSLSVEKTNFSLGVEDHEHLSHIQSKKFSAKTDFKSLNVKDNVCSSQKSISFSDLAEPDLSFEDINEYLNNLPDSEPVLDEDSGVSSQEDVNGNNVSVDGFDKGNEFTERADLSDSNENWSKILPSNETLESNADISQCSVQKSMQNERVIISQIDSVELISDSNVTGSHQLKLSIENNNAVEDLDSLGENTVSECETVVSTGAIPKRESTQANFNDHENTHCSVNTSENFQSTSVSGTSSQNSVIGGDLLHLTSGNDSLGSLPVQNEKLDVTVESNLNNNEKDFSEIHSSSLAVDVHDSSQNSEVFFESVSDAKKPLDLFVTENDSSVSVENLAHSPKLQRPTTLNLPCRNATAPVSSFNSDVIPPALHDSCDGLPEDTQVEEALLEDKNIPQEGGIEALPESENVNNMPQIGSVKPFWVPDSEAANCMHCNAKFTVLKRRHHCRACGKVLCSNCCNQKARLPYLPNKENRVCQQCFELLSGALHAEKSPGQHGESPASSSCGSSPSFSPAQVNSNFTPAQVNSNFPQKGYWRPHPNNPDDYCSTISPLQQVQHLANRPPPTVMVPVGVLKRGTKPRGEPKQVIFSDGIRPGGDLTDLTEPVELVPAYRRPGRRRVDKVAVDNEASQSSGSSTASTVIQKKFTHSRNKHNRVVLSDLEGPLPPILFPHDQVLDEKLNMKLLMERLKDDQLEPIVFAITKNLHVLTKITKLDSYYGKECWCFTSHGLCTVGQDEVLFILERFADEDVVPRDVFRLFSKLYDNASKGSTVSELGHIIFSDNIFGNWEHRGFLFVRPTFQILNQLVLPNPPFLVAILIQKWEVPWAKVFPLRLMLRLGEECRHYPCSLVSTRFRKPVYYKIGETIMSVLADLRNYQFTIPFVPGLVVHIEEKKTCVNIPRNRYEKLMKVLSSNNVEHVLALGANFSTEADSHLVCMQTENGDYVTQAMNIKNTTRKVTGASFIVFSGALKTSTGFSAKFSIVEDGLLIQIPQETMDLLHSALREMRDLTINCGPINTPDPDEVVIIQWTKDDKNFNIGVRSPVDGRNLGGVSSLRIHISTDYASENYLIRWTEVFFLEVDENSNSRRIDAIDPCRLAETVAQACCMALIPFLDQLADAEMTRIGLRVTLDTERDKVEYEVGAQGQPLPSMYMNALDSNLIPVISRVTGATQDEPIALELIFHVLIK